MATNNPAQNYRMIAKTFFGLEQVAADELRLLGAKDVKPLNRAVEFTGDRSVMYKANLWSRTVLKVLVQLTSFPAINEEELYRNVKKYDWPALFDLDKTFAIDSTVHSSTFTHSKYVALKTKDAIADHFRDRFGRRPNVNVEEPDVRVNVHITKNHCTLSLDSSGEPLFKRGYRQLMHRAPINETLAAGIIMITGWKGDTTFIDPMCGSGTFLTEAAMIAANKAPGAHRAFGFMKWSDFDERLWTRLSAQAENQAQSIQAKIIGVDKVGSSIRMAEANIQSAGFTGNIELYKESFERYEPPAGKGVVVMNPPYGERLQPEAINGLYKKIGDKLKQSYAGYDAWIISSNKEAMKHIGLRPSKKIQLYNGPLECKLHKYKIVEGKLHNT